ncbi:MAG: hypothetical protein JXB13_18215 [Phycisphaerae bacterium]|nr:hypothetical protein [Phycisphaerae bacterium]
MREGRTHRICWRHTPEGYEFWVKSRPDVRLACPEITDDLGFELDLLLMESGVDTEPLLTFDPPLPNEAANARWLVDDLAVVAGNAYAWLAGQVADYYEGGVCKACRRPQGPRNEHPLVMSHPPEGDLCFPGAPFMSLACPLICSERFRSLLTPEEQACADWLPIERGPRSRRKYFECVPHHVVSECPIKGSSAGWRCVVCGFTSITSPQDCGLGAVVAHTSISVPRPPMFGVGSPTWQNLVLPGPRARAILKQRGSRGVYVRSLGVAEADDVESEAQFRPFDGRKFVRWRPGSLEP